MPVEAKLLYVFSGDPNNMHTDSQTMCTIITEPQYRLHLFRVYRIIWFAYCVRIGVIVTSYTRLSAHHVAATAYIVSESSYLDYLTLNCAYYVPVLA
jgi:hypothetical protein